MKTFDKVLVLLAIFLGIGLGYSKVLSIKKKLPSIGYARGDNVYGGYLCIDGYAQYSEKISSFLQNKEGSWDELIEFMKSSPHPSSFLGPIFIGLLNLVIGNIPASYMIISSLASILSVFIVYQILSRYLKVAPSLIRLILILLITHNHVLLSFSNLYQAPVVMLFICLAMVQTLRVLEYPNIRRKSILVIILTLGLFTKVSFLPVLGMTVFTLWIIQYNKFKKVLPFFIVKTILYFAGIPLIIFALYHFIIPGFEILLSYRSTINLHWAVAFSLKDYLAENIALFQIFIFLWLFNKSIFNNSTYIVCFLTVGLYYINFMIHSFPSAARLYLPIVPGIILLAVPGIKWILTKQRGLGLALIYGLYIGNIGLAIYSIIK